MKKMPNLLRFYMNFDDNTVMKIEINKNVPELLYKTICGMLNKNGGHIFIKINQNIMINKIIEEIKYVCDNYFYPKINIVIFKYLLNDKIYLYINLKSNFDIYKYDDKTYYKKRIYNLNITYNPMYLSTVFLMKNNLQKISDFQFLAILKSEHMCYNYFR